MATALYSRSARRNGDSAPTAQFQGRIIFSVAVGSPASSTGQLDISENAPAMSNNHERGGNLYAGFDMSPTVVKRPHLRPKPSHNIYAMRNTEVSDLRQELGLADRWAALGKGSADRPKMPPAHLPSLAPSISAPDLGSEFLLPVMPKPGQTKRSRPPFALHDDQEANIATRRIQPLHHVPSWVPPSISAAPPVEPRRIATREREWIANMDSAANGLGPDPLAVHILRKHGRRFQPGGLASQAGLKSTTSFQTLAIANMRMCIVENGRPKVRQLVSNLPTCGSSHPCCLAVPLPCVLIQRSCLSSARCETSRRSRR